LGPQAQLRRAAASAPTNIFKGSAQRVTGGNLHSFGIALDSASEVRSHVGFAKRIGILTSSESEKLVASISSPVRGPQARDGSLDKRLGSPKAEV